MENRPVLSGIDFPPFEHGLDLIRQTGLFGQTQQQLHGPVGDPVLGIIEQDVAAGQGETIEPPGIVREQFFHVKAGDLLVMGLEGPPGR